MQSVQIGCGKKPAFGPIENVYDHIWKVNFIAKAGITNDIPIYSEQDDDQNKRCQLIYDNENDVTVKMAQADDKKCGDYDINFDTKVVIDIYVCYDCITDYEGKRQKMIQDISQIQADLIKQKVPIKTQQTQKPKVNGTSESWKKDKKQQWGDTESQMFSKVEFIQNYNVEEQNFEQQNQQPQKSIADQNREQNEEPQQQNKQLKTQCNEAETQKDLSEHQVTQLNQSIQDLQESNIKQMNYYREKIQEQNQQLNQKQQEIDSLSISNNEAKQQQSQSPKSKPEKYENPTHLPQSFDASRQFQQQQQQVYIHQGQSQIQNYIQLSQNFFVISTQNMEKKKFTDGKYSSISKISIGNNDYALKEYADFEYFLQDQRAFEKITQFNHQGLKKPVGIGYSIDKKSGAFQGQLIMELADFNLSDCLENGNFKNDPQIKKDVLVQLLQCLVELHSNIEISHNNLKPSNILISNLENTNQITEKLKCQLSDLRIFTDGSGNENEGGAVNFERCDPRYSAPEFFIEQQGQKVLCSEKNDIWSIGCIIQEMFTNKIPYQNYNKNQNQQIKNILRAKKTTPWDNIKSSNVAQKVPKNVQDIIIACLQWEPVDRIDLQTLLDNIQKL